MVLCRVGEAVEKQVYAQEGETVDRGPVLIRFRLLFAGAWVVECESRNAQRDEEDDAVLVQRVAFLVDGQMEEHYGEEFA